MTMKLTLRRYREDEFGTHGELQDENNMHLCWTIEQPWRGNHPWSGDLSTVSCIPPTPDGGTYHCQRHDSQAHPKCWELTNVPDRSAVLIHTGNTVSDTHGCIIIGQLATGNGVANSRLCLEYLNTVLPEEFDLVVIGVPN